MSKLFVVFLSLSCFAAQTSALKAVGELPASKEVGFTLTATKTLPGPLLVAPAQMFPSVLENVVGVVTNKAELLRKMLVFPLELKMATFNAARGLFKTSKVALNVQTVPAKPLLLKQKVLLKKQLLPVDLKVHKLDPTVNLVETEVLPAKVDKAVVLDEKKDLLLEKKEELKNELAQKELLLNAKKEALLEQKEEALLKKDMLLANKPVAALEKDELLLAKKDEPLAIEVPQEALATEV